MRDDLVAQLRTALDGTMDLSPSVHRLLYAAAVEIERLRVQAARDKRGGKRGDDDGAPEAVLAGPPKRPRGPLLSSAASIKVEQDGGTQDN
jgi:hypothetical protein